MKTDLESSNYSKQMHLYISGQEAGISEWDTAIKDYENERSKCRYFNPLNETLTNFL